MGTSVAFEYLGIGHLGNWLLECGTVGYSEFFILLDIGHCLRDIHIAS